MSPTVIWAQKETFPFVGEIIDDNVNVRAGQSENFERLCQLKEGDQVLVLGKAYSWYRIELPPHAYVYISQNFVKARDDGSGLVTGRRINVRSGPGLNHSVLGQVQEGDILQVVEHIDEEWLKIRPVESFAGYIAEHLLTHKTQDIDKYDPGVFIAREKLLLKGSDLLVSEEEPVKKPIVPEIQTISVLGFLEKENESGNESGTLYKLVLNNQTLYYFEGISHILDPLLNHKIHLEGHVDDVLSTPARSFLEVTKIQLLL